MSSPASRSPRPSGTAPELTHVMRACRRVMASAGVFSGLINMLALSSSLYMLQVYDRVIPSHSVPTLVGLSIGMAVLFAGYGLLDVIRARLMSRVSIDVNRGLRERVVHLTMILPLRKGPQTDALQPVRDLDQLRAFASSGAPVALFDLPWMPFYLALVWLLHPWLGILAVLGALVLVGLTILTETRGRGPTRDMDASRAARLRLAETVRRNSAAIQAMGMEKRIASRWNAANESHLADQTAASDVVGTYGAISRVMRLLLQSAVLGLGAYLVINGQATGGVMIASSILVSRALAPVEVAIANWRGFIAARQSWRRMSDLLLSDPVRQQQVALPKPIDRLDVEGLWVQPPGGEQMVVANAGFTLKAGSGLGIIGPSASGKSTLARVLIGAWLPARGTVRLDGATLDQWSSDELGKHIGYLPQELELIDGTIADNISRFEPGAPSEAIIAAAREAGVHDMIVRLPNGYDTRIGEAGAVLSAGQRQRVALARALYRDPFLVVLDEPNSNLDRDGDIALEKAVASVRSRGGIVIVVAHRPSALAGIDQILVMTAGQPPVFGPKEEVFRKLGLLAADPSRPSERPLQPSAAPISPAAAPAPGAAPQAGPSDGGVRLRIISEGS